LDAISSRFPHIHTQPLCLVLKRFGIISNVIPDHIETSLSSNTLSFALSSQLKKLMKQVSDGHENEISLLVKPFFHLLSLTHNNNNHNREREKPNCKNISKKEFDNSLLGGKKNSVEMNVVMNTEVGLSQQNAAVAMQASVPTNRTTIASC